MKAFVTGGSGFVGHYLGVHLRDAGDEVTAPPDDVDITDRTMIGDAIGQAGPDVVYHLAALSHVGQSWTDPARVVRVNVEGTLNVLEAAREHGVKRVLVIGSAEEYGRVAPHEVPLREDAELRPTTPYGATKTAAAFLALQAFLGSGLDTVRVRAFTHTGPGQPTSFLIPALANRIAVAEHEGRDSITVGALDPIRDISDVRDVVRAYRLLVERGTAGEVYNVCRGDGHAVAEVARHLLDLARRPLTLEQDPALSRPSDTPRLIGDVTKLHTATGWKPQYSLAETLAAVLEHERARVAASA